HAQPYINDAPFPACRSSNSGRPAGRGPRASSSTDRAATHPKEEAAHTPCRGSVAMGLALTTVVGLAFRPGHRQTGDRHRLAPTSLSLVLDLEGSSRSNRTSQYLKRNSRSDPIHKSR